MDEPRRDAPLADPAQPGAVPNDMPEAPGPAEPARPGGPGAPAEEDAEETERPG